MIIIVDSGSTKSDWAVINDDESVSKYAVTGINPTTNTDLNSIHLPEALRHALSQATEIHFYAAGLGTEESNQRLLQWLKSHGFKGSATLLSDIYAAIRSTCGLEAGIVGILGTGSNSCLYDGKKIVDAIPSLGYILSDEGGGVDLGKKIVSQYFYRQMPVHIQAKFELKYHISRADVLHSLYKTGTGSKYLASFSEFLVGIDDEWKDDLISESFDNFVKVRILPYANALQLSIHFVGSIAYYYQEHLAISLKKHNLRLGKVIKTPLENLIIFHSLKFKNE